MASWSPEYVSAAAAVAIAALTLLLVASAVGNIYQAWKANRPTLGIDVGNASFYTVIRFLEPDSDDQDEDPLYEAVRFQTVSTFRVQIRNNFSRDNTIISVSAYLDGKPLYQLFSDNDEIRSYDGDVPHSISFDLFVPRKNYKDIDQRIGRKVNIDEGSLRSLVGDLPVGRHKGTLVTYRILGRPLDNNKRDAQLLVEVRDVHRTYTVELIMPRRQLDRPS